MDANQSETESTDDENVFFFETEHLALRGNQSYTNILRTMAILQAQRIRVHQQINDLEQTRNLYLVNPQLLIDRLRNKEPPISPNYIATVNLPELPRTAHVRVGNKGLLQPTLSTTAEPTLPHWNDDKKTPSFNRLWSNEEQRRLEQLLIEYPPEEVEMRRFSKIAKALGNRTPQQVFSRVQKYFQKLRDAGMPVPGRIPKHRRPGLAKPKFSIRRSTFFPAQNISMHMPEDDFLLDDLQLHPMAAPAPFIKTELKMETVAGDEAEPQRSVQQLQLDMLSVIHEEKLSTEHGYSPDPLAPKCAECSEASVTRSRWHCNSCYCYVNLCADCLAEQLISKRFEHITHDVVVDGDTS